MKYFLSFTILLLLWVLPVNAQTSYSNSQDSLRKVYVGTYTQTEHHVEGKADGIYLLHQNKENGKLSLVNTVASITNPSFVKVGKQGKYLYAVSELSKKENEHGFVYSFKILENGGLSQLNKLSTSGWSPSFIALDQSGKFCFVSNYNGGVVMLYKIDVDGYLVPHQKIELANPGSAHPRAVKVSGDNRFAYVADLGNNKIWIYKFDAISGNLTSHEQGFIDLEAGAGPRHLSLSKNGSFLYSVNELNSTLSVFQINKNGGLKKLQDISTFPQIYRGKNSAADLKMHPNGKFLYASNRGHNSIATFKIDVTSGELSNIGFNEVPGKTPRSISIAPLGKYLYTASQDTGLISTFKLNEETGKLKLQIPMLEIKTPVCLEFVN